jgi:hypothetical protein
VMLQASHDPGVDPAVSHVALPRPEFLPEMTENLILCSSVQPPRY